MPVNLRSINKYVTQGANNILQRLPDPVKNGMPPVLLTSPDAPWTFSTASTDSLCSQCASLSLSVHKFTARPTLTATSRSSTITTVVQGEFDSIGFDPTDLGFLDQIYQRSNKCTFCRLIYHGTHSESGQGIGHDGLDKDGNRVTCKIEWHLDSRTADSRPTTRRLRIFNDDAAFSEFYVVPVTHANQLQETSTTIARIMDRDAADLNLLSNWLDSCRREHPDCNEHREKNLVPLTKTIRMIDVFDMCIREVHPSESPTYAALSYVWGVNQQISVTTETYAGYLKPGSLLANKAKVPQTIWGAFEVVRQLGIPYIWVDALCILQDSVEDKVEQIQVMDKIYQHAMLTLCVAWGEGSHSGIPGVDSTPKHIRQSTERYRDLLLTTMKPVTTLIGGSIWDSRAWTFQERLLSTRCAVFTSGGLVWQCPTMTWREDMISPLDRTLWSLDSVGSPLRALMGNPLRSYSSCVHIYSSRKLTVLGDKLEAFNGLSTVLGRKLDSDLMFGLPSRYFDWALLWEPEVAGKRITPETTYSAYRNVCLPSWSWCGWDHEVNWRLSTIGGPLFNLNEWLTEHTWIVWRLGDPDNNTWKLIHDSEQAALTSPHPIPQPQRWDGYTPSKTHPYGRTSLSCRHADKIPLPFSSLDPLSTPIHHSTGPLPPPTQGALLLRTFTTHFTLSRKSMSKSAFQSALAPPLHRFGITDISGDWCGTIILDGSKWMNHVGAVFEFAAISDAKEFTLEELDTWTYYIPEERGQAEWYCFYAVMLRWRDGEEGGKDKDGGGNGRVAERVGLAKIFQSSFWGRGFKGCEWRDIVLA